MNTSPFFLMVKVNLLKWLIYVVNFLLPFHEVVDYIFTFKSQLLLKGSLKNFKKPL